MHRKPDGSWDKSRLPSRHTTVGPARAAHRSYDYAMGLGRPIALVRDGDMIAIDADKGSIELEVAADDLTRRKAEWAPRKTNYQSGALWKYARGVGPVHLDATTHPGAAAETHTYADI